MEQLITTSGIKQLFTEQVQLTGVVEYGFPMQDLVQGNKPIPAAGARFDIGFEGRISGSRINGTIKGTDFLEVRADGRFLLHLQACIHTDDGATIKVEETGTNDKGELKLWMRFHTNNDQYAWLNTKQVLGLGHVDLITGKADVTGYLV